MDITKLPKWAQEHIASLQRQRDEAVRALNEWTDSQTKSPVWIQELNCTREGAPEWRTRYVQTAKLSIEWQGVRLDVYLHDGPHPTDNHIRLQWSALNKRVGDYVGLIPKSFQHAELVAAENLRNLV